MTKSAVTEDASAASVERPDSEQSLETGFLPDDPHYRLTGQFKSADTKEDSAASAEKTEKKDQAVTEEVPAASESEADTAAASATAETQETKPAKTARTSENRWQKLSRENRELRERLERIERGSSAPPEAQRDTQQASQPAAEARGKARPEPKIDEVDAKTGKPKYATYEDFMRDLRAWDREEALRQFQETSAKTERERQLIQAEQALARGLAQKLEPARKAHADFDQVALNPDLVIPKGSVVDGFILDSEHAGELLYYLGQHPEILDGFYADYDPKTGRYVNKVTPFAQARELSRIEFEISGKSNGASASSPARHVTQAPRPPHQVSGKGTVAKDAVEQAIEDGDTETYIRAQNAKELARLKGR